MRAPASPPYWNGPQLEGNWRVIWYYVAEHVRFTLIAVAIGALLAFPIAYVSYRFRAVYPPVLAVTNVIYAIPSLALFALLGPFLGWTNDKPIILAMALYTLVILVRNIVEGLRAVPPQVSDAATGLGYRPLQQFFAVELPMAVPTIVTGLRLATVSTISLITVGGAIGKGALGRMFADGIDRRIPVELWAGGVAVIVLALIADVLLLGLGRLLTPWTRVGSRRGQPDDSGPVNSGNDDFENVGSGGDALAALGPHEADAAVRAAATAEVPA